jgi:hypothetical protein
MPSALSQSTHSVAMTRFGACTRRSMLDIVYGPMPFCIGISPNLGNPNSCAQCRRPTLTHGFEWFLWKRQVGDCYARLAFEVTAGPGHLPTFVSDRFGTIKRVLTTIPTT